MSGRVYYFGIRTRLALGHLLALSLALVLFSGILYGLYRSQLYSQLDLALRNDLEHADDRIDELLAPGKHEGASRPENWLVEVWKEAGARAYASAFEDGLPLGNWDARCLDAKAPVTVTSASGLRTRVFCQQSSMHRGQYVLRVARLSENVEASLAEFVRILALAIPLVLLFSAWMGLFLAKRALGPVSDLTERARRITASNLEERLPVENPNDELGRLAQAFNETFSRLARSFRQMRRFTADASHELRTPLTAIRALGEVALSPSSAKSDHREVIANILEETDRLRNLCDSLLLLSRADAGQIKLKPEAVGAHTLVTEVLSLLGILAEEKHQTVDVDVASDLRIQADPALFKQAVTNLIDNAIKYSPEKAHIRVHGFRAPDDQIALQIIDEGPGISKEYQSLVFERFYRIDQSRSRQEGGAGLGLSIVKWIVELHEGTVSLESEMGKGSRFEIRLPGASA
jgi:heavy metal sensor kinase